MNQVALLVLLTYFGVDEEDLIVIYDDLDLEVGKIRLRQKVVLALQWDKSLIAHLGTNVFPRIKIGIGQYSKMIQLSTMY